MDRVQLAAIVALVTSVIIAIATLTDAISKLSALLSKIIAHIRKTTIPVHLGWDRWRVRKALGPPDKEGSTFDTFFSKGLVIHYGKENKADGILASRLDVGTEFGGRIYGIRLGDSFEECVRNLGNAHEWGKPDPHFSLAVWPKGEDLLLIEVWRERPTAGRYADVRLGTVKSITLARKNSILVFQAVVAVAIEFIRQGQRPPQLEEIAIVDVDLRADYFHEDYEIFGTAGSLMGGANVGVAFAGGQALRFWIYPLAGIEPAIRAIGEIPPSQSNHER
jgi:hypothetical protein